MPRSVQIIHGAYRPPDPVVAPSNTTSPTARVYDAERPHRGGVTMPHVTPSYGLNYDGKYPPLYMQEMIRRL